MSDNFILSFGKYKSKHIDHVFLIDPAYCRWLSKQSILTNASPEIKAFLDSKFTDPNDTSYLMTWGRCKGKTLKWIFNNNHTYFDWLSRNKYIKDQCPKLQSEINSMLKDK